MNYFKVGYNFDIMLPEKFDTLNQNYDNTIEEVYGSIALHDWLAARPTFRLPQVNTRELEEHVKKLLRYNIDFNYTFNAPFLGSTEIIEQRKNDIIRIAKFLQDIGVKRITISSPLLAEIIKNELPEMELELSTIAHLSTVTQLKAYKELVGLNRVCMNLEKYRNVKFLKKCAEQAKDLDLVINLMTNEFCLSGGKTYCTHCIYRQDCYNLHSVNKSKEDAMRFNTYPMNRCIMARNNDEYNWLRSRFILPQWLKKYNSIGIDHFKITGRTGGTDYLVKVVESYMKEYWDGNLLELWKQLQSIYDDKANSDNDYIKDYIDCKKLDNFIDHWFDNEDFDCSMEMCGTTCTYCQDFYNREIKGKKMKLNIKTERVIGVQDWDMLVGETYKRPYNFQQQEDCQPRGTYKLNVPDIDEIDFENDTIPEIVNHPEMGVSFKAWLERDPKQKLDGDDNDLSLSLWWNRNFYPSISMVANDLHKKGLLEAGEYTINIDW